MDSYQIAALAVGILLLAWIIREWRRTHGR
jgi:hypothetical protein